LEAQALLIPVEPGSAPGGWLRLSRRAHKYLDVETFVPFIVVRRLDRMLLHEAIRAPVWGAFIRGHFEVATLVALKAVEVAVYEAVRPVEKIYGNTLIAKAFDETAGALTDFNAEPQQRKAMRDLFFGAIGLHRNPLAHRPVTFDDPVEAIEIVMLANHLLRIVDRQRQRRGAGSNGATPVPLAP
jgi:uncharacterized protein (TIGR02391 family)